MILFFFLVTFNFDNNTLKLDDVNIMKYKSFFTEETKAENLNMKFIINKNLTYVYNSKVIFPILVNEVVNSDVEKIEFHAQDDKILAAACFNNIPLFFSKLHGFVSVSPSDFDPDFLNSSEMFNQSGFALETSQFMNDSIISASTTNIVNLTMYDLDPNEIYNDNKDLVSKLKAAFVYHLKRNTVKCKELLRNLIMAESDQDGVLDHIVIKLAQDLTEDVPAADPRWENVPKHALGSSSSMQIIQQLREKNLALNYFIDFLHHHNLWDNVSRFELIIPFINCFSLFYAVRFNNGQW